MRQVVHGLNNDVFVIMTSLSFSLVPSMSTARSLATPAPNTTDAAGVATLDDVERVEQREPAPLSRVTSTYDLLRQGSAKHPTLCAMSFFLRTTDYRKPFQWNHDQWFERITAAGNMFRSLGIGRKDVITYILPNLPETHWTIWGGEAAGIVMAINPLLEPSLMAELMNAAKPRVLVTLAPTPGSDIWEKAVGALASVPSVQTILTVSPLRYLRSPMAPLLRTAMRLKTPRKVGKAKVASFTRELEKAKSSALEFDEPQLTDVASYFCTGGTTGMPKIAVRTHRTEVANALQLHAVFGRAMDPAEGSIFCGLPLFHVNAQIGTGLAAWAGGAHVVLGTPMGYRAPGLISAFWDISSYYRCSTFSGVPTVYSALLQYPPKGQDLSGLRYGICGAAPMPKELFYRFQRETNVKVIEGYGLTEGGCVSSLNPPEGTTKLGSIGIRLPWQDMKAAILDEDGTFVRDASVDEPGTVLIYGPNLFEGYLNPSHNKGVWVDYAQPGEPTKRWLNTGDLARQDDEGYFWLTGRKKELIIRGGHNIDPKLIEEAMCLHPAVAMAAAVGRPDAHAGEIPVVYVQLRPGLSATEAELAGFSKDQISERAAWPKQVSIVQALPTTAIGKVFKPALSMLQLESVVQQEAKALGIELTTCKAAQDPKVGLIVRWSARGETKQLVQALSAYTFHTVQVPSTDAA